MTVLGKQRMAALDKANEIRLERAVLKREVRAVKNIYEGKKKLASILIEYRGSSALERATLWEMLTCVHRMAGHFTARFLICVNLPANKQIGTLTNRQFEEVISKLEGGDCDSD